MGKKDKFKIGAYIFLLIAAIVVSSLKSVLKPEIIVTIASIIQFLVVMLLLWESIEYQRKNRELRSLCEHQRREIGNLLGLVEENMKLLDEIQELKKTIKNQNISIGMYKHNSKIKSQKSESSDNRG